MRGVRRHGDAGCGIAVSESLLLDGVGVVGRQLCISQLVVK